MARKEDQYVVTDQEIEEIKNTGIKIAQRFNDVEMGLITNYVYNILDYLMRRHRGKDVAITLLQISEIINVNHMTIWAHLKKLKELEYIATYYDGIPRRQFFVNHYEVEKIESE